MHATSESVGDAVQKRDMNHYWAREGEHNLTAEDIIAMQTIDADCNDCKHFKRGEFHRSPGLDWFEGHCMKFDKDVHAYPMQFSGLPCFEHRKS